MQVSETGNKRKALHCHPAGGDLAALARSIAALGDGYDHHVVCNHPDAARRSLRGAVPKGTSIRIDAGFPDLSGRPSPGRLVAIAQAMRGFDCVLTHGWAAINAAMAHTVFAQAFSLPPLIHHEGFGDGGDATAPDWRRDWFRRIALNRTAGVVVPGRFLKQVAQQRWKVPSGKVHVFWPGIDTAAYARKPDKKALRLVKRKGERWIGTFADLSGGEGLTTLVEACTALPDNWHLVIFGEGPQRDSIGAAAAEREIGDRVHLPGPIDDPTRVVGLFDIYATASERSTVSIAIVGTILGAMAARLPVVAIDRGDVGTCVAQVNIPYLVQPGDVEALSEALAALSRDDELRADIGEANRDRAQAQFDTGKAIGDLRAHYADLLPNPGGD